MRTVSVSFLGIGLALGLALLLVAPTGTAHANDPVAEVDNNGRALVFYPLVEFKELVLTVTGPCNFEYRQVVSDGSPYFELNEETIDGVYTYSLVVMPKIDGGIIEILQDARATGDNTKVNLLCRQGKLPGPPATQSQSFTVLKGELILSDEPEEKRGGNLKRQNPAHGFTTTAPVIVEDMESAAGTDEPEIPVSAHDFVINDDLIVDGSACIGFDCVNGESFGFDTIRLKENNLRIKFDDTSVAASFPRTDWQLTANASANGGASKFSIDDISGNRTPFTVEANARSHSLYVDDGGRIGSRTSTPSTEIHTIDGDTPTLRLQQDGSSGFAPQTWDVAGNETNFFIRDVTNGSTLPFRIRPGAPTSSIFIDVDGDVGLATTSPSAQLHIAGDEVDVVRLTNNGNVKLILEDTGGGTNDHKWVINNANTLRFAGDDPATAQMSLNTNGNLTITGTLTTAGSTYPDYVFDDDYELMPLEEVASFIKQHKHLPNVPTSDDVEGGRSINISELQIRVLEKVEELTLYTLAQEAVIEEQKSVVERLESTIQFLEDRIRVLESNQE